MKQSKRAKRQSKKSQSKRSEKPELITNSTINRKASIEFFYRYRVKLPAFTSKPSTTGGWGDHVVNVYMAVLDEGLFKNMYRQQPKRKTMFIREIKDENGNLYYIYGYLSEEKRTYKEFGRSRVYKHNKGWGWEWSPLLVAYKAFRIEFGVNEKNEPVVDGEAKRWLFFSSKCSSTKESTGSGQWIICEEPETMEKARERMITKDFFITILKTVKHSNSTGRNGGAKRLAESVLTGNAGFDITCGPHVSHNSSTTESERNMPRITVCVNEKKEDRMVVSTVHVLIKKLGGGAYGNGTKTFDYDGSSYCVFKVNTN